VNDYGDQIRGSWLRLPNGLITISAAIAIRSRVPDFAAVLYERLQSGEVDRMRQRLYNQFEDQAPAERMLRFVKDMGDGRW
jgi:hypothetical protein